MTIIAFTPNKIYTDKAGTTGTIARTIGHKVQRIHDAVLVAVAGLALTQAEVSCMSPLIPQILNIRTPHDAFDMLDELRDIYRKSDLESTIVFVTPSLYIFVTLNPFRTDVNLFTREEMGPTPMAIGSGAVQFLHQLELGLPADKAAMQAALNDPHCGRGIIEIDISDLGKGVEIPPFIPRPKPSKENRDRPKIGLAVRPKSGPGKAQPMPFPFPLPPIA